MPRLRTSAARALAMIAGFAAASACGGPGDEADSVRFATDTAPAAANVPAGPLPAPTAADAGAVMDATEFPLTDENFRTFVRASEALSYMRARDTAVRAMLEQAGTDTADASVLERLEQHPQISQAIRQAGMTVKDYYVMAIALASAQRWAGNPDAAPPTPVGRKNAEWVRANRAQLAKLQTWGSAVAQ